MDDKRSLKRNPVLVSVILLLALALGSPTRSTSTVNVTNTRVVADQGQSRQANEPRQASIGKEAESMRCSSADDCLRLSLQYLDGNGKLPSPRAALAPLQRAVELDPANAAAQKALAMAYVRQDEGLSIGHMPEEEFHRAEVACRSALSLAPNDAEALLLLGQILSGELYNGFRSDDSAVNVLKRALEVQPAWPDAYCVLARTYSFLSRYEDAVVAYETEETMRRESEDAQRNDVNPLILESQRAHRCADLFVVAQIHTKSAHYDKALTSLRQASTLDPEDDVIRFWIGRTLLSLGEVEQARREQSALAEVCKAKNEFFVSQCEAMAKELGEAIRERSK